MSFDLNIINKQELVFSDVRDIVKQCVICNVCLLEVIGEIRGIVDAIDCCLAVCFDND